MYTLKVLIVEDDQQDAELVVLELQRLGYEVDWKRTESAVDTQNALVSYPWDLVITDFTISRFVGFSAFDVLALVAASRLDIPVLLMTGALKEHEAVEFAGLGCCGYILKDRLKMSLGFHVKNCLQMADARRTATRLTRRFQKITDNPLIGIMLITSDGIIQWQNAASLPLLGWNPSEMVGQSIFDFMHPQDAEQAQVLYKRFLEKPGDVVKWYFRLKCNFAVYGDTWRKCLIAGHNLLEDEDVGHMVGYFSPA